MIEKQAVLNLLQASFAAIIAGVEAIEDQTSPDVQALLDQIAQLQTEKSDLQVQLSTVQSEKDALAAQVGDLQSQLEAKNAMLQDADARFKAGDAAIPDQA